MRLPASIPVQLTAPLTFLIFIVGVQWYGNHNIAARAFSSLSLFQLLTTPLQKVLSSFPTFAGSLGSFQRIQAYLVLDDRIDSRLLDTDPAPSTNLAQTEVQQGDIELQSMHSTGSSSPTDAMGSAIACRDGDFAFSPASKLILHDIDITCAIGSLTMVIGPIGSGKTTLMNAILGEIVISRGTLVSKFSQMAYCPQTPWVINATIKENILDHTPWDEKWYQMVLWCCALDEDINNLPAADNTVVGSRGITLSGGQKQRLSIARAVYARKSLVLLDDVLSALDARTEKVVFERLFSQHGLFRSHNTTVILVSHAVHHIRSADRIIVLGQDGHIVQHGKFEDLSSQDGYVQHLLVNLLKEKNPDDSEVETALDGVVSAKPPQKQAMVTTAAISTDSGNKKQATGETAVFAYYFKSIGAYRAAWFLITTVACVFCTNFPQVWVQWWTESKTPDNGAFLGAYFGFAVGAIVSNAAAIWCMMIIIVPISAAKLHWQLLNAVLHAPLSFFSSTDSGMTLNRFSQDMSLINSRLPVSTMQATTMAFQALAQIALMATGSTYFAAFIPIFLITTWMVQKFYLRTSRQLRLLDLEQKSPLFSSISETLEGLSIIRAFGRQKEYEARNQQRLDASQRPVYLLYCIQRWLNLVLDLIVAALAVLLITLATQLPGTTSGAALGVALLNVLGFSQSLAQFIYFYTDLETSLQAVARVKDYVEMTEPEDPSTVTLTSPPENWPAQGSIEFRGITASYTMKSDPVIKELSVLIRPGRKVGICGRTASGKSSLLSALFRMMELRRGAIYVDGIDLSTIPRQAVRSSLIAIPQEPLLLPGSVRFNVSPVEVVTDDQIVTALQRVGLWMLVQQHQGGLDGDIDSLALSHGQQQLLCLARAILRPGTVLVLDEATSNVDWATDEKMQQVIREEFHNRTILTVAHRLTTILDSDQVVVMGHGTVLEAGPPDELLARRGHFWELYEAQTANHAAH
jgi:ATP-binding cassette subfamily C (CFTR/MRP) protein 1